MIFPDHGGSDGWCTLIRLTRLNINRPNVRWPLVRPSRSAGPELGRRGGSNRRRPWDAVSWWYSLLFVIPVVVLVGNYAIETATRPPTMTLGLTDAFTGQPVSNVSVTVGNETYTSNERGEVKLRRPAEAVPLALELPNYEPVRGQLDNQGDLRQAFSLRPNRVDGVLADAQTRQPIGNASVSVVADGAPEMAPAMTGPDGTYSLTNVPAQARLRVDAGDYGVHEEAIGSRTRIELPLRRAVVAGLITDASGAPVQGAIVTAGEATAVTQGDGTYRLTNAADVTEVVVAGSGFTDARVPVAADRTANASLERVQVKAIYANGYTMADPDEVERLIQLIDETELNALVVDIKQDTVYYDSQVAFFREAETVQPLYDVNDVLKQLKDRNIYAIARMVIFQDPLVAYARPDLAVKDEVTGGLWRNYDGVGWVNAFNEELWHANVALAVEASELGFDEIQYDYVRFPSDGDLTTADFGQEYTAEARQAAITGFLQLSHDTLAPRGIKLGADIFGYTAFVDDEQGIGQNFAEIVPLVDYVCMMIYPSHFSEGNIQSAPGHPNDYPYETILESLQIAEAKVPGSALKFRPWLQDFSMPLEGYRDYGAAEVRAQIDAAEDFGASGWMLWNPSNEYQAGALNPA